MKKDLSSAKERVKEALKREQEERNGPRKRRSVKLMYLNLLPKNNTRFVLFRSRGEYFYISQH